MKVELRKIDDIKPYPNNPRLNDDAVEAVAASIREFGFRQPIVVDNDGVIICGHTRYKAALKLGLDKVPVHVAKEMYSKKPNSVLRIRASHPSVWNHCRRSPLWKLVDVTKVGHLQDIKWLHRSSPVGRAVATFEYCGPAAGVN